MVLRNLMKGHAMREYETRWDGEKFGRQYFANARDAKKRLAALPLDHLPATVIEWGHGAIIAERVAPCIS